MGKKRRIFRANVYFHDLQPRNIHAVHPWLLQRVRALQPQNTHRALDRRYPVSK